MPEDIFKAKEDLNPQGDNPPAPVPEKELTEEEMLEMPDEDLKKLGMDDPKMWKTVQRTMHRKEAEWNQFKQNSEQEKGRLLEEIQNLKQGFESIKNPPKPPEVLEPPKPPADPTDPIQLMQYQQELRTYDQKVMTLKFKEVEDLKKKVEEREVAFQQQQRMEQVKGYYIGQLIQNGLNADVANTIYSEFVGLPFKPAQEIVAIMTEFAKFRTAKPSQPKKQEPGFVGKLPPGLGGSGSAEPKQAEQMFNSLADNKHKNIFATK